MKISKRIFTYNSDHQGFGNLDGLNNSTTKQVSQAFSNMFNFYAKAYNKLYNRMGSLFVPRVRRVAIYDMEYLKRCTVYIYRNPIHHGFVSDIREWPHTSFTRILNRHPDFLMAGEGLNWFGSKEAFVADQDKYINDKSVFDKKFLNFTQL